MEAVQYTITEEKTRVIKNQKNEIVGIIYHHMGTHAHLVYECQLMSGEGLAEMIAGKGLVV